jgi:putative flippase GtrA
MFAEFFKFSFAYTGTFLLSIVLLPLITELLVIDPRISVIMVMAIIAVGSYLLNSKYVFLNEK